MRRKSKVVGVVILFLLSAQLLAFGADKTFFIKGSNITRGGSTLTTNQILFFLGNTPLTLNEVGGAALTPVLTITSGQIEAPTAAGRNVQYSGATVGQTINAEIWQGAPNTIGSFYHKTSLAMNDANYGNSTLTWDWTGMSVNYKADAPYKPNIDYFEDVTTSYTNGSPAIVNLKAHSVAGTGSAQDLREVNGYSWKWWQPADPTNPGKDEPQGNGTPGSAILTLNSNQVTAGVTYAFRVSYSNQWSGLPGTWSDIKTHQASAAGGITYVQGPQMGATTEVQIQLTRKPGGFGINSVGIPFGPPMSYVSEDGKIKEPVVTLLDLLDKINAKGRIVRAAAYWEPTEQQFVAAAYDNNGQITGTTGNYNAAQAYLFAGRGYYLSVTSDLTFKLVKDFRPGTVNQFIGPSTKIITTESNAANTGVTNTSPNYPSITNQP